MVPQLTFRLQIIKEGIAIEALDPINCSVEGLKGGALNIMRMQYKQIASMLILGGEAVFKRLNQAVQERYKDGDSLEILRILGIYVGTILLPRGIPWNGQGRADFISSVQCLLEQQLELRITGRPVIVKK